MTDDQIKAIRDDLAFMRALAQEGAGAPLLGGGVLAAAGAFFGLASVAHWAVVARVLAIPAWGLAVIWSVAALGFVAVLVLTGRRQPAKPGANAAVNRATQAAWSGAGGAIFVLFVACAAASWRLQTDVLGAIFPSAILALYGACWAVAASMTGKTWIRLVALASWAAAAGLGLMAGRPEQYLVYAAALFGAALIPGLVLMRGEPRDTV